MLSNSWQSWNFLSSNDKNDDRKQMFLKDLALILKVLNPGKIFHVARNPFVVYYLQGIYVHSSLTPDPKNTVKTVILLYENITSISLQ